MVAAMTMEQRATLRDAMKPHIRGILQAPHLSDPDLQALFNGLGSAVKEVAEEIVSEYRNDFMTGRSTVRP